MNLTVNPIAYNQNTPIADLFFSSERYDNCFKVGLFNGGSEVCIDEIILCDMKNPFSEDAEVYGEGYSMLSQYKGTVAHLECIGCYDDTKHYRLPKKEGFATVFNMAVFQENGIFTLIGFTSCHRFSGQIRFNRERLQIVLDFEGKTVHTGEEIQLEGLYIRCANNREELLADFADKIAQNHPILKFSPVPDGWCSWYCFGPNVTEQNILENLDRIRTLELPLRFIQVDDGYQKYMGDWLTPADSFPNGIKPLFDKIRQKGFEPAIWVAPFIAEENSDVFQQHPDWFVQDENGHPLSSADFTFGGWRCAPWYMLDPTNPQAYEHLRSVFACMRQKWNCRYFKLDANMWGAFPNGIRFDRNATAAQSYRLGMQAILEGAGEDSFLLGCNAPMWPSIGTVHGNRITGDVSREYSVFTGLATEAFHRNWQNGTFWINDPDCVTIEKTFVPVMDMGGNIVSQQANLSDDEFLFHATYIYATGGMVLSGDDLAQDNLERLEILRFLLKSAHQAAKFDDTSFRVGRIAQDNGLFLCLFNWGEQAEKMQIQIPGRYSVTDVWHQKELGVFSETIEYIMQPHSGVLLDCQKR